MKEDAGYHELADADFISACRDYFYLVDRHFPERGVLKLVGDRYRLTGDQRTVLYRGISSRERSEFRNSLLVNETTNDVWVIDGYNVLFTLLNYRLGRNLFISTDGILRDAGSLHGKLRDENTFSDCIGVLLEHLAGRKKCRIDIYLDSPVSHSEKHAQKIRERMQELQIPGDCMVIRSADWALKQYKQATLSTSDTAIIEKAAMPVIDLPRAILEHNYAVIFPELKKLIGVAW
jgi:hypothetical protein